MHKRSDFIEYLKENINIPQCRELMDKMYEYYKIRDLDDGSIYSEIYYALYFENHQTYDEISALFYIPLCTLDRYRIRFNNLALLLASNELKSRFQSLKK